MDDPPRQPNGEPLESEDQASDTGGSVRDCSSDLPPDPVLERVHDRSFARPFDSLPHHPAHLFDRLLSLPPIGGLRDIVRTLWFRRKNPFRRVLWREFWGRYPLLLLFVIVLALSFAAVPFVPVTHKLYLWAARSGYMPPSRTSPFMAHVVQLLIPYFLTVSLPTILLSALFAWKIRPFFREPVFDSELAMVPNWRPFVFRAIGVQFCVAAVFLILIGAFGCNLYRAVNPSLRAGIFPSGAGAVDFIVRALDLRRFYGGRGIIYRSIDEGGAAMEILLSLIILTLVFSRARSFRRALVFGILVAYAIQIYRVGLALIVRAIMEGHVMSVLEDYFTQVTAQGVYSYVRAIVPLIVNSLLAGTVWSLAYRSACRAEGDPKGGS